MAPAPAAPEHQSGPPSVNWPNLLYGLAFTAFCVYAASALIYSREHPPASLAPAPVTASTAITAPCPVPAEGQVTHITVRVENGELVAQCARARGRK